MTLAPNTADRVREAAALDGRSPEEWVHRVLAAVLNYHDVGGETSDEWWWPLQSDNTGT